MKQQNTVALPAAPAAVDGDADAEDETEGDNELLGLVDALAEIEVLRLGLNDVDGLTLLLGLTLALPETEGDKLELGDVEADAERDELTEGLIELLGLVEADGDTSPQTVPTNRR